MITIYDELVTGEKSEALTLNLMTTQITVRELIRRRIYEEVQLYNISVPEIYRGLVQPTDAEVVLNGYKLPPKRRVDWEKQFDRATKAFQSNGFFILVDDHQVSDLDEFIELKIDTQISFVKLTPLVGG